MLICKEHTIQEAYLTVPSYVTERRKLAQKKLKALEVMIVHLISFTEEEIMRYISVDCIIDIPFISGM